MAKDVELDTGQHIGGGNIGAVPHLVVTKGDTRYTIKLYDAEAAAGQPGDTTGTLKIRVGNANYYASMTTCLSGACGGDTPLRYKNSSGTTYQVTQKAEWTITIDGSSGQNICVSANGQTYKGANTLWLAEGTTWNAWVEADENHYPGNLNISSGTLTGAVHLTVSAATYVPNGSLTVYQDGGAKTQFVVPSNIYVIHTEGGGQTHNIRVTPGKTYYVHEWSYTTGTKTTNYWYCGTFNDKAASNKNAPFLIYGVTSGAGKPKGNVTLSWSKTINGWGTDYDAR